MRSRLSLLVVVPTVTLGLALGGFRAAAATTVWPMYHLDPSRTGNDTGEPSFSAVSNTWTATLDGKMAAEPLVYGNRVIAVTENNSVYALNAITGAVLWGPQHLGAPRTATFQCGTPYNPMGITSTPVIDGGYLYVVAEVQITANATPPGGTFQWHLSKIDPTNGVVSYTTDITPAGMTSPTDHTDPQSQRGALAVSNGNVVISWGGINNDCGTYHGYVETVAESTGAVQHEYHDTPSGNQGGIWAPSGPAVDSSGNIFVTTGNGSSTSTYDYGDSVLKLSPTLSLLSFFAPVGWETLNTTDQDLGSVGAAPLPGGLLFAGGKAGKGYLLEQSALPSQAPSGSSGGGGEDFSAQVCHDTSDASWGGIAVSGTTVYMPCVDGVAALSVDTTAKTFSPLWYEPSGGGGGPPIVAGGLVWTAPLNGGTHLYGLNPSNGQVAITLPLPSTNQHFATPAAGDGMLFIGDATRLVAFAPPPPPFRPQNVGAPSVTIAADGTQLVFWQGAGGHLMEAWWNTRWNGPVDVTAANGWAPTVASAPSVAIAPDGTQLLFWRGPGGHLTEAWWNGQWNGPVDWTASRGWAPSVASAPSVAIAPNGTQMIFWQGPGGHLVEAWWNGSWNGPVDWTASNGWGQSLTSAPSVAIAPGGTQLVFWQGAGGHLLEAWWNGSWNGPVDWTASNGWPPSLTSAPSVAIAPDGSQLVFWRGTGGDLTEAWWKGGWNGPVDWSAANGWAPSMTSAPSVAIAPNGTQLVFWQGSGGQLIEAWWNGKWNGPADWSA